MYRDLFALLLLVLLSIAFGGMACGDTVEILDRSGEEDGAT